MNKAQYAEYLKSDWWTSRRERALERALHRCQNQRCRMDYLRLLTDEELAVERDEMLPPHAYRLEVHHLTYVRLGREADNDLIVLCPECHADFHGLEYVEEPFSKPIGHALANGLERMLNTEPVGD